MDGHYLGPPTPLVESRPVRFTLYGSRWVLCHDSSVTLHGDFECCLQTHRNHPEKYTDLLQWVSLVHPTRKITHIDGPSTNGLSPTTVVPRFLSYKFLREWQSEGGYIPNTDSHSPWNLKHRGIQIGVRTHWLVYPTTNVVITTILTYREIPFFLGIGK